MENQKTTELEVKENMVGDCDYCGHSIVYHAPLFGCTKWNCGCEEFH